MRRLEIKTSFEYQLLCDVYEVRTTLIYTSKDGKPTRLFCTAGVAGEVFRDGYYYKEILAYNIAQQMSHDLKQNYKKRVSVAKLAKSILNVLSIIDLKEKTKLIK